MSVPSPVINLGIALVAILVGYCFRSAREWFFSRRGQYAGYWLWVTYGRQDNCIWSVEIVKLGHKRRRKEDLLSGTVWRLYDRDQRHHWNRRWSFIGWHVEGVIEGVYKWTRDETGSHGVIHVWKTEAGFDGIYIRLIHEQEHGNLVTAREEVSTEWRRLRGPLPERLQRFVDSIPPERVRKCYPWRVRRKLKAKGRALVGVVGGFPYGSAVVDNRGALKHAGEKLYPGSGDGEPGAGTPILTAGDLGISSE